MRSERTRVGLMLAGLGSIVLAIDLWQPWYAVRFPSAFLDKFDQSVNQAASQLGPIGGLLQPLIHQGVGALRNATPIVLSAHDIFKAIDIELLVIAIVVLGIAVASTRRQPPVFSGGDGTPIAVLGAIAAALVLYRIIKPPTVLGSDQLLVLRPGIWVGLISSCAILIGGLLARTPDGTPARAPAGPYRASASTTETPSPSVAASGLSDSPWWPSGR